MLYILFSITIVACIFVPRFYSFVYDIIFTKMRRHIRQIETSYFRVYNVIFWRNGHLVGWNLTERFYLLPLQHLKTYE